MASRGCLSTEARLSTPFVEAIMASGASVDRRGKVTTNAGGLDEYFAAISSLRLPEDMERLQEISKFCRYKYLPSRNDQYIAEHHGAGTTRVHVPE